jgi:hypothetical protein
MQQVQYIPYANIIIDIITLILIIIARALLPSSFESLIVQSFYVKISPIIVEKLVCGQLRQTCHQINLPHKLEGKKFIDLFRIFLYHNVLCFGLFRAPQKLLQATTSYVFVSPPPDTVVCEDDKLFLFGTSEDIKICVEESLEKRKNR